MAQGFHGSICLNDLFTGATIVPGPNGKPYLDLTSLPAEIFQRSEKNGKTYFTIFIDVKDELDQFNQCARINLPKTAAQKAANAYSTIIGNLKYLQQKQSAPAQQQPGAAAAMLWGAKPEAAPAQQWGAPAQQAAPADTGWSAVPGAATGGLPF